uniref:RING-type domain-containing protein n=1 Tax=Alexandrium monilatum TaxID=311494 RepID=A0A7S4UPB7_9DINO
MESAAHDGGHGGAWARLRRRRGSGSSPQLRARGNPQDFVGDDAPDALPRGGGMDTPGDEERFLRVVRQRLDHSREQVEQLPVPSPSAEAVRGLPREALCPICHGPLRQSVALNPCGHAFCGGCVAPWLQRSGSCPTCRAVVPRDCRWLNVRVLDELVEALRQRSSGTRDVAAGPGAAGEDMLCSECCHAVASETCCHCGASLLLCRPCAETRASQCEECEGWFCRDWCAARPCLYCSRPHVCKSCKTSPLSRCPRPEC